MQLIRIAIAALIGVGGGTTAARADADALPLLRDMAKKYSLWCQYATTDLVSMAPGFAHLSEVSSEALKRGNDAEVCAINNSVIKSGLNFIEEANNCAKTLQGNQESDARVLQQVMLEKVDLSFAMTEKLMVVEKACAAIR